MNILITGSTGFIGRYLADALSAKYFVRCLVRNTSNIKELKNLNVDIVYGDLLDKTSLGPALNGIDLVYHLAGEVYSRRKKDYYKGNVLATQILLEACKEKGIKRIIFLSSVGVYKPVDNKTLLTEDSECNPITYYGKTKLQAEEIIKNYNIPWVIVRAPVVYGPRQPDVIGKLFTDAIIKKKIFFLGNGEYLRSLCFVRNLVEGLRILAEKSTVIRKTFIISDAPPRTFNEIISDISLIIKQRIKIIYLPNFLGDIAWQVYKIMFRFFHLSFVELYRLKTMQINIGCDITKAREEIGYTPVVNLTESFRLTIDWIRSFVIHNTYSGG